MKSHKGVKEQFYLSGAQVRILGNVTHLPYCDELWGVMAFELVMDASSKEKNIYPGFSLTLVRIPGVNFDPRGAKCVTISL